MTIHINFSRTSLYFVLTVLLFVGLSIPVTSYALSVSWSKSYDGTLYSFHRFMEGKERTPCGPSFPFHTTGSYFACGSSWLDRNTGWTRFMSNSSYDITYEAVVEREDEPGVTLNNGDIVPVGTVLHFKPKEFTNTDIPWSGFTINGFSGNNASSYGFWQDNVNTPLDFVVPYAGSIIPKSIPPYSWWGEATPPVTPPQAIASECSSKYYVGTNIFYGTTYKNYVAFVVKKPLVSIDYDSISPTAAVLAWDGNIATVMSEGTIDVDFVFAPTQGRFYSAVGWDWEYSSSFVTQYKNHNPYCRTQGLALREYIPSLYIPKDVPFDVSILEQRISISLEAEPGLPAPDAPAIEEGPTNSKIVDESQEFTFTGSDSEGADIRYGIDWNKDGSVDEWLPTEAGGPVHVPSGTSLTLARAWATAGDKTFQVHTNTSTGFSLWTEHTIAIAEIPPPDPTVDLDSVPLSPLSAEGDVNLKWTSTDTVSCTSPDFSTGGATSNTTGVTKYISGNTSFEITCLGENGNSKKDVYTVNIVYPKAGLSVSAEKYIVLSGDDVDVTWSAENVISCTFKGPGVNYSTPAPTDPPTTISFEGEEKAEDIKEESKYTLSCINLDGEPVEDSAIIRTAPSFRDI